MTRLMGVQVCVSMMGCQRLGDEDAIWRAEEDIAPQNESVGETICPTTQDSDLMFNPEEK